MNTSSAEPRPVIHTAEGWYVIRWFPDGLSGLTMNPSGPYPDITDTDDLARLGEDDLAVYLAVVQVTGGEWFMTHWVGACRWVGGQFGLGADASHEEAIRDALNRFTRA